VNATVGVASALCKVVVYDSDQFGRPNALLSESADIDVSSSGVKAVNVSLSLRQGRTYWLGLRSSSTATLSTWPLTATPDINGGAPASFARKVVRRTLAYATAATTTWGWNSSEVTSTAAPAIWLKI
jgi:hypothetical protein